MPTRSHVRQNETEMRTESVTRGATVPRDLANWRKDRVIGSVFSYSVCIIDATQHGFELLGSTSVAIADGPNQHSPVLRCVMRRVCPMDRLVKYSRS